MSQNIFQVFQANPITSNASTDLMYFGQSPYGAGNDAAMTFVNFNAQIVANGTANQIAYYATTGNKISPITAANNGVLITNNTGVPSLLANSGTPGFVLTANSGAPPSWQALGTASGAVLLNPPGDQTIVAHNLIVSAGNIQAGTSGSAGSLISLPSTASKGALIVAAVNNATGNFNTTISNASAIGQNQTISIPDTGTTTANFVLTNIVSGPQVIASDLTVATLRSSSGNIIAGTPTGVQGSLAAYSPTSSLGFLNITCANNAGNFGNILTNASTTAARTWTLPDATGTLALTSGASGIVNSGTMNQLAYYAATGTTVSGLATANNGVLITSGGGVPSISSTLPSAVQANITQVGAVTATSINFGGTTLSTYTEGTFVPTVTFATPGDLNVSYATHTGRYTQIGRMVFGSILLVFTPTFTTASGQMRIATLPNTVSSSFDGGGSIITISSGVAWDAGRTMMTPAPVSGATYIVLSEVGSAVGQATIGTSNIVSGVALTIELTFYYSI